jgi:hypothetical protein
LKEHVGFRARNCVKGRKHRTEDTEAAEGLRAKPWQRQREEFWQWVYVRTFETAITCPDVTQESFSRYSDHYARDVAFQAAEHALQDLDLSRRHGQLSRKYYFVE